MKIVIVVIKRGKKNRRPLIIGNVYKTIIAKVTKVLSTINLGNKYNWAISNANIDITGDLRLININKILEICWPNLR